jgi:hypothetical protein
MANVAWSPLRTFAIPHKIKEFLSRRKMVRKVAELNRIKQLIGEPRHIHNKTRVER